MEKEFYTEEHAALRPIMLWRVTRSLAEKKTVKYFEYIMYRDLSCGNVLWRVTHITAEEQAVEKEFCIEEYSALQSIIRQCALAGYVYFGRRKDRNIWKKILRLQTYHAAMYSGGLRILRPIKKRKRKCNYTPKFAAVTAITNQCGLLSYAYFGRRKAVKYFEEYYVLRPIMRQRAGGSRILRQIKMRQRKYNYSLHNYFSTDCH